MKNDGKWLYLHYIVSLNLHCCFRKSVEPAAVFPILNEISLLCGEVAQWSCCHSLCLWCISPINYLHKTRTISSPIMHHFNFDCQLSFLPWSSKFSVVLLSVSSLRRSQCSPGLTTWRTRSCWTWFLCSRALVRRRTFTVCYRAWGTGSRRRLQLVLPASAPLLGGLTSLPRPHSPAPVLQPVLGVPAWPPIWGPQAIVPVIMTSRDNNCMGSYHPCILGLFVQDSYWQKIILLYVHTICF